VHLAALRINTAHDVLDRAVFPGYITRLQNEKQGTLVVGVESFLCVREFLDALLQELLGSFFERCLAQIGHFKPAGPGSLLRRQIEISAGDHPELIYRNF